jgi:DNA-binding NtrC family response regulator/tetratricopeptide (TPR) repeat protein
MRLSYEAAARLFAEGEFLRIIEDSGQEKERQALEPRHRVIVANALAFGPDIESARRLAEMDCYPPTPSAVRSQAESVFAYTSWRLGEIDAAVHHAQCALRLAQEAAQPERIAWAHLHLFRFLIARDPVTKVLAALPEVRSVVARAGTGPATACLHTYVAVLEGHMGRMDEARRHLDIADSILQASPNLYVRGSALESRGCMLCVLNRDFNKAVNYLRAAKQASQKSGHLYTSIASDTNLGHIQLLVGDFSTAQATFSRLLHHPAASLLTKLAAAGGLARVHLALNQVDQCERALRIISESIERDERIAAFYHVRWEAVTEARLFLKRGQSGEAIKCLEAAERVLHEYHDAPLNALVHLTVAQAHARCHDFAAVSRRLIAASDSEDSAMGEFQAQYYFAAALILRDLGHPLETQLKNRALRVWADQGIVSVPLEMDDAPRQAASTATDSTPSHPDTGGSIECITDSLAAFTDLAHRPRLLGAEMVAAIKSLGCSPDVRIVETREDAVAPEPAPDSVVLPLGVDHSKQLTLVCRIPADPVKAIVLADVFRIGRAALALERARAEERNRAALWPAPPIEEQAGALFLAEEMQTLLATVRRIASTTVPVLITGETGTGKEVLARTIHGYSTRSTATFLPFNCSGVPKDMLDSQLFGHRKGAFTGASDSFSGVIRAAAGGTLFLDEIGETTLDVQPKLLRFLESNEVHPIGEAQPVRADVRIIAATNADLDALVAHGRFREDLFYRLNIVRLHLPPLRERRVEIPPLAHHYLQKHAREYSKGNLRLAEETMEYLVLYRWPGNVRQLANEMRRMAALAEADAVLMPEHLSPEIATSRRTVPASERALDPTELVVRIDQPMAAAVQHLECAMIQHAMRRTGGRMEETAAMLGLSRKGLYLKRVRYGLESPDATATAGAA